MLQLLAKEADDVDRVGVGQRVVADHSVHDRHDRVGIVEVLVQDILFVAHLEHAFASPGDEGDSGSDHGEPAKACNEHAWIPGRVWVGD